jgi:hypothetical protein
MTRHLLLTAAALLALIVGQELVSCQDAHAAGAMPAATDTQRPAAAASDGTADLSDRVSRVEGRLEGMEAASTRATSASEGGLKVVGPWILPLATLVVGVYVGRLGFRTEAMKLRHSIAERRLREFDGAAGDLLKMMLEIGRQDSDTPAVHAALERFRSTYPEAGLHVVLAAELAMLPAHRDTLTPLTKDLLDSCRRAYSQLTEGPRQEGESDHLVGRMTMLLYLLMQAVDTSTEARLEEWWLSWRYSRQIRAIAERWGEETRAAGVPGPGEGA